MRTSLLRHRASILFGAGIAVLLTTAGCTSKLPATAAAAPVTLKVPVTVTVSAPARTVTTATTIISTVSGPLTTVTETATETEDATTSTEDSASTVPTGLTVGGSGITASNSDGGATIDVLSASRKKSGTGDYGEPPKNGNYVLIDVSYTCTTGTWQYNPFDWKLRDGSGRTYDSSGASSSGYDDAALQSGTVSKSAKARGILIFDAPKTALTLEYAPGFGGAPATWVIPA